MPEWPADFLRMAPHDRTRGQYSVTWNTALKDLMKELRLLEGATSLLVQRMDEGASDWIDLTGQNGGQAKDPGVIVTFRRHGMTYTFAHDDYKAPESNLRAIGKTIEAMRTVERLNVLSAEQVFGGVEAPALPAHAGTVEPYVFLGVPPDAGPDEVKRAYRNLSKTCHPDKGGTSTQWAALQKATRAMGVEV